MKNSSVVRALRIFLLQIVKAVVIFNTRAIEVNSLHLNLHEKCHGIFNYIAKTCLSIKIKEFRHRRGLRDDNQNLYFSSRKLGTRESKVVGP